MEVARVIDAATGPLDRLRFWTLRWVLATPSLRWMVLDRDRRIGVHAVAGVTVALGLTAFCPAALFVVGPLLLGVPHVASDLRYLLLRRAVPRGVGWLAATFCAALFALRVAELRGVRLVRPEHELMAVEVWVGASVVAAARGGGSRGRALALLAGVLTLGYLAQQQPDLARLAFAHLHNVVGVALWLLLFRRRLRPVLPALAVLLLALGLIVSGRTWGWAESTGGLRFAGQHLASVVDWVAPVVPPRYAAGAVLSYVFLQAIHYSVWLAWVPQEDNRAEGTTSFGMSVRSARHDLGALFVPIALGAALVPLLALRLGAVMTRDVYLSLASFHGYLELAMGAFLLAAPTSLARRS